MTHERMLEIINCEPDSKLANKEEVLEAYTMYFGLFGVTVKNPDNTYKSLYQILEEANNNMIR